MQYDHIISNIVYSMGFICWYVFASVGGYIFVPLIYIFFSKNNHKTIIKAFKDLSKEQQAYTTLRFLRGIRVQEKQILKTYSRKIRIITHNIMKNIISFLDEKGIDV